jgi:bisanhydrobacterioruberin hydratase
MILGHKNKIAIGLALLFHFSGFIGMMTSAKSWFVALTPLTLILMFALLIWTEENKGPKYFQYLALVFIAGMIVEIIGVNTSMLFGVYEYGSVMGLKLLGVPLLMGIQWFATIEISAHLIRYLLHFKNKNLSPFYFALTAALVTTIFDIAIEPVAMDFDYWNWEGDKVPMYNYVCWFVVSFILHWAREQFFKKEGINIFSAFLFLLQVAFFLGLILLS